MLPVIFIHGLVGPFRVPSALSLHPDLLGYGAEAQADPAEISIDAQVEHVRAAIDGALPAGRAHVVGHSIGGVIAAVYAHRYPERVASFVNVEGNFTLADAFWSAQLATKSPAEIDEILRAEPAIAHALGYQPATTVRAMARAVIEFTGDPSYEPMLREVFARTPVHLVAGARSRAGWDVPDWALAEAASYTEIPDAGHMVMDDAPEAFGELLGRLLD